MSSSLRFRDEVKKALEDSLYGRRIILPEILEVEKLFDKAIESSEECDLDTTASVMEAIGWKLCKIMDLSTKLAKEGKIDPLLGGDIIDDLTKLDSRLQTEVRRRLRKCEIRKLE